MTVSDDDAEQRLEWPDNAPLGVSLYGPDPARDLQLLAALGHVIRCTSNFDRALQTLFCALVASPMAAVIAAGQSTSWLMQECRRLADHHPDIEEVARTKLHALLLEAKGAVEHRNRLAHDGWGSTPDGQAALVRSQRGRVHREWSRVTVEEVVASGRRLTDASFAVENWIVEVLGHEALSYENALRWRAFLDRTSSGE